MSGRARRTLLGVFLFASIVIPSVLVYRRTARRTPKGQRGLVSFQREMLEVFRDDFNRQNDRTQVIVVLTMTGPEVLESAARVQELLDRRPDRPLRVFLFWQPPGPPAGRPPTTEMLGLVRDTRVAQFWDPARLMSGILGKGVTAVVYPPGGRWGDGPPGLAVPGTMADLSARLP